MSDLRQRLKGPKQKDQTLSAESSALWGAGGGGRFLLNLHTSRRLLIKFSFELSALVSSQTCGHLRSILFIFIDTQSEVRRHLELVVVRLAVRPAVVVWVVHGVQEVHGEPPAQAGLSHKHVLQEHERKRST